MLCKKYRHRNILLAFACTVYDSDGNKTGGVL